MCRQKWSMHQQERTHRLKRKHPSTNQLVVPSVGPDFETIFFMMRRARLLGFIEKGMFF